MILHSVMFPAEPAFDDTPVSCFLLSLHLMILHSVMFPAEPAFDDTPQCHV